MKLFLNATVLPILLLLSGCESRFFYHKDDPYAKSHEVGAGKVLKHSYKSMWRASTVLSVPAAEWELGKLMSPLLVELRELDLTNDEHKERFEQIQLKLQALCSLCSRTIILAENPPDTIQDLELSLMGNILKNQQALDLGATYSDKTQKILEVYGYNVFLRDALYRLNEAMLMNPTVVGALYETLFTNILQACFKIAISIEHEDPEAIRKILGADCMSPAKPRDRQATDSRDDMSEGGGRNQ